MGSIAVRNLGKAYKHYQSRWSRLVEWILPGAHKPLHSLKWVLQDVSFDIAAGETVGIVGVNGAGKSTLLKMITGTTFPTHGTVTVKGRVAALLELGMGFHPDFTGRQNAIMACQLLGFSHDEILALIPEIEAFADVGNYFDETIRVYSSGMQARLAFAVATASRPDILIVDEALSVGDARFQAKCYERINLYKAQGMTLLLVSHAVMDLVKHCERALFIHEGMIKMDGRSRDVVNFYMDTLFARTVDSAQTDDHQLNDQNSAKQIFDLRPLEECPGYRSEEYRWGGGGARILACYWESDGAIFPTSVISRARFKLAFSVFFERDFEHITPGILIKTIDGMFVSGANAFSATDGDVSPSGKSGSIATYVFEFNMMLNDGDYLLSIGISEGDPRGETTPVDRRYDAIIFGVVGARRIWGVVDLNPCFKVVEIDRG